MLHPTTHQIKTSQHFAQTLISCHKPFISGTATSISIPGTFPRRETKNSRVFRRVDGAVKAVVTQPQEVATSTSTSSPLTTIRVKAGVTVKQTLGGCLSDLTVDGVLDDLTDFFGKSILLELVGAELDPQSGLERPRMKNYARKVGRFGRVLKYECEFEVRSDYGQIGAVVVENQHRREMFLQNIYLDGLPDGPITITCDSWLASKFDSPNKRIFFTNKSYLPSQTPSGLKTWREIELKEKRGYGLGERKKYDRIYDYDVYNDLGDATSPDLKRPVLGGNKEFPYPRRCRTGRQPCSTDPSSESRSDDVYVPRDEAFSELKLATFSAKTFDSALHAVVPYIQAAFKDPDEGFPYFAKIDTLFNEGINVPGLEQKGLRYSLPRLIKFFNDFKGDILQFEVPVLYERDRFSWYRDEEFSRQTLAGLNPCCIQLVTEWPLMSKLDPKTYGPPESAITKELVEREIKGIMTVEEAVKEKKLFMLDYHDLFLPYVSKVRGVKGTTFYGSRTLFFLTPENTLRPIVIELTRPPLDDKPAQWKQVFTPTWDATGRWLWKMAKSHVLAHDSGYHQLISHWLRTHCCTEPYIIATNRQLSVMHPIYRLLHPHFRYTMEINALARKSLINAGGIIESAFSPSKYSIELSAVVYGKLWQFDLQALPKDLINRGMAVEDPDAPHGLKLTIEDYPYANDGLILWDIIKQWVSDYVTRYYPEPSLVASDQELQAWWTEIRTVGHGDKKDEPWWPKLNTPDDLTGILTTMIWVASGHHSAVNFGQYGYAGYFPNRPTITRQKMPTEDPSPEAFEEFVNKPEAAFMQTLPSQVQATTVMTVLDVLSCHSEDEEYIGEVMEASWGEDPAITAAFDRFRENLQRLEETVDARNRNWSLKNRCGAGVVPYELLKPKSGPGVTGKGVPNSISI